MTEASLITTVFQQNTVQQNKNILKNKPIYPEFSIINLLNNFQHLPDQTALLGVVDEEIPVMFDLKILNQVQY